LRTNPKWICVKVKKPACLCRTSNIHQLHSRIPIKKRKPLLAATATGIVIYSSFILHCLQENVKGFPKLFRFFFEIPEHTEKRKVQTENRKGKEGNP